MGPWLRSHGRAGVTSPQTIVAEKNPGEALTERNVWRAGIVVTFRVPRSH